jgi:hypothetical protein
MFALDSIAQADAAWAAFSTSMLGNEGTRDVTDVAAGAGGRTAGVGTAAGFVVVVVVEVEVEVEDDATDFFLERESAMKPPSPVH